MRFDEPELVIDSARDLGEQVGGRHIAVIGSQIACFADRLAEGGERPGNGESVLLFIGDGKRVRYEEGVLGRHLDCALGNAAKAAGAFGNQIGVGLDFRGNLVE